MFLQNLSYVFRVVRLVFERTSLFSNSQGASTTVVGSKMYIFVSYNLDRTFGIVILSVFREADW